MVLIALIIEKAITRNKTDIITNSVKLILPIVFILSLYIKNVLNKIPDRRKI